MVEVQIYVEGGGDRAILKSECRRGFSEFLRTAIPGLPPPRIIPCGGRESAWRSFVKAVQNQRAGVAFLLVDSEAPMTDPTSVWQYLGRQENPWRKPPGVGDEQAHLMVECMEAWLVSDPETLEQFFGQGFRRKSLPARRDLESVPKDLLFSALRAATKSCKTKGAYDKGRHSFDLLCRVDPEKVIAGCRHARSLVEALRSTALPPQPPVARRRRPDKLE